MRIELPVTEAVAFAKSRSLMPPMIESLTGEGSIIEVVIDLHLLPADGFAMKLFAAAAGTVTVTATFAGYAEGTASFDIAAEARGIHADKLLSAMVGRANDSIRESSLPDGVVEFAEGADGVQLLINLQQVVGERVPGVTVTGIDLREGVLLIEAAI